MSILKLLGQQSFDIATTMTLASAFDSAWLTLQKAGGEIVMDKHADGTRDLLAQRLVAIAAGGKEILRRWWMARSRSFTERNRRRA